MTIKFQVYLLIQADLREMLEKICEKFRLDGPEIVSVLAREGVSNLRSMIGKIASSFLHGKRETRIPLVYIDV